MFFDCHHPHICYIGRWGQEKEFPNRISATACGSKIRFAFSGRELVLFFDMEGNEETLPHLYISLDGGPRTESTLQQFIRVDAMTDGAHTVEVIYKSAVEVQARWFMPLVGKVSFKGFSADAILPPPPSEKKTIELVGDSITEGVLIDAKLLETNGGQPCRPFQDDVTATYGYLTAEALGLEPYCMGYGAVGATKAGCGAVPKCAESYPYAFDGVEKNYSNCDYILINHGANDRRAEAECYIEEYEKLLDLVTAKNPRSKIIVLSAFCGAHHEELGELVQRYNEMHQTNIAFIDSFGWVPAEPLHPLREGHKILAEHLIPLVQKYL